MDHRSVEAAALPSPARKKAAVSHPSRGGWNAAIFIIFVEVAERFTYYGLAGNLITYLMKELGQPMAVAAQNVNVWVGLSAIFPVAGAFIADSYIGRFRTILISSVIYLTGMIVMTFSVSVVPRPDRKAVFFTALYILALGEGGHKPCIQTFAADQFNEELPEEKMAKSSFFNWWYMGIVAGATIAIFFVIYLQDNVGWTVGALVLTSAVAIAMLVFLVGYNRYRRQRPAGSPFVQVAHVIVAALKKRHLREDGGGRYLCYDCGDDTDRGACKDDFHPKTQSLARTNRLKFLDKAMIIDSVDESSKAVNPWRLCSLNQVEEVKLVFRLIPIWLSCIMFTAVQAQAHTFFVKQGATMVRSIGGSSFQISPASLQGFQGLTILAATFSYDRVFVPLARNITGHPSGIPMLRRIGIGLFLSIINMIAAACMEIMRLRIAANHGLQDSPKATVPMSIWWLMPQYMLCGISDVFTIIGLQELFYDHVPEEMRSMGAAAYVSVVGVGSFLSSGIIAVVQLVTARTDGGKWLVDNLNRANLDGFYWVMAGLSAVNFCVFLLIAKGFEYKKIEEVEMDLGCEKGIAMREV
ncbi:hypothetical protein SAY86_009210 [Trapa natans]|uniref:Uncharacterized protein n=1 Tax=Trapa natans TaxID=22666 RepID=A0AAN7QSU2_TRANT|nr:hypothetical protein SAY86_009210 [Trapa natans]